LTMSSTEPEAPAVEPEVVAPPAPAEVADQQPPALVPTSGKAPMVVSDRGVQLRSFAELWRFAQMCLQGGAAPKGMKTIGQVAVAIQTGMEAGLTPMHSLQAVVVINGNTSWRGQSAVGLIRADPRCKYIRHWTEGKGEDMKGVCVSRRVGADREEKTEFTVANARTAKLWGRTGRDGDDTPWVTYPDRQLMWRAVGFHGKDHWSDVLGGFPIAEEAQDYPVREDVTVRQTLPPPSPDPLLAEPGAAVVDVQASVAGEVAPCCGKPHRPSQPCPE
jgi:hypothetical protein